MEAVLERRNLFAALKRVKQNKGSPGIDGMTVDELPNWLRQNWPRVREELLAGTYQPSPVRRQLIPKSGGGMRELGIPTVLDRLIQQALLQVLQPRFDPTFSEHSHGFRPGRRAHDAVRAAQRYIQEGRRWVVDVDLERFLDDASRSSFKHSRGGWRRAGNGGISPGWRGGRGRGTARCSGRASRRSFRSESGDRASAA